MLYYTIGTICVSVCECVCTDVLATTHVSAWLWRNSRRAFGNAALFLRLVFVRLLVISGQLL